MNYVNILAGGIGKRMGNVPMPKQFMMLKGKPVIIHTIEKFLLNPDIDKIIVSLSPSWYEFGKNLINKYLNDKSKLLIIEGGLERNDTLMKAVDYIEDHFKIGDDDNIITHDAVRPFITNRIIEDNLRALQKSSAVDTVVAATDTIVVGQDNTVTRIPDRQFMYQGQTPQSFKIRVLKDCYDELTDQQKATLTDGCKICVYAGVKVALVRGENFNIKITTPVDLRIANAIVQERKNDKSSN